MSDSSEYKNYPIFRGLFKETEEEKSGGFLPYKDFDIVKDSFGYENYAVLIGTIQKGSRVVVYFYFKTRTIVLGPILLSERSVGIPTDIKWLFEEEKTEISSELKEEYMYVKNNDLEIITNLYECHRRGSTNLQSHEAHTSFINEIFIRAYYFGNDGSIIVWNKEIMEKEYMKRLEKYIKLDKENLTNSWSSPVLVKRYETLKKIYS